MLAQQFGRLGALFFYESCPVIRCDHSIFFEWASTFLHVIDIQVALPILEGLIRCLHDPFLHFGLGSYGNSKPLNPILPNIILVFFWHLTPIIMNDTDRFPCKASTIMCCWPLNLIRFHWHPCWIDLLHYSNLVGNLFLRPFFCRGSGSDSEGPVVVWASCSSLCAAADPGVSSIMRRVFFRRRWYVFGRSSVGS